MTMCILLLLTGCTSSYQRSYQSGEELLEQEQYEEASAKFQELGSYEDSRRLLMYSRAALAAENGDYETARIAFHALGAFRDALEMLRYYEGREAESAGRTAFDTEDTGSALHSLKNAAEIYESLSDFRDAPQREADCLNTLYERGSELFDHARYSAARDVFDTLGNFEDSADLKTYCEACLLEAEGAYLEAAGYFSAIQNVRDAATRADQDREMIYQQAVALSSGGDQETAISLLTALGSYRDADTQLTNTIWELIRHRLNHGDYEGALLQLDSAAERFTANALSRFWMTLSALISTLVRAAWMPGPVITESSPTLNRAGLWINGFIRLR